MEDALKLLIIAALCLGIFLGGAYITKRGDLDNAQSIEELDSDQRSAIFAAWKKSDHFLGGSSTTIILNESLDLDQNGDWKLVEVEGVKLLVGIVGRAESQLLDRILG